MVYEYGRLTLHGICQSIGHHGIIIIVNIMVLFWYYERKLHCHGFTTVHFCKGQMSSKENRCSVLNHVEAHKTLCSPS